MTIATDKVGKALRWTMFLLCLAVAVQGRPPAHSQTGMESAHITPGETVEDAAQDIHIDDLQSKMSENKGAIDSLALRIAALEHNEAESEGEVKSFGWILTVLTMINIVMHWFKRAPIVRKEEVE